MSEAVANDREPNTAPTAERGLSGKGVSNRGGSGEVDRGCTQGRAQQAEGCCCDLV